MSVRFSSPALFSNFHHQGGSQTPVHSSLGIDRAVNTLESTTLLSVARQVKIK